MYCVIVNNIWLLIRSPTRKQGMDFVEVTKCENIIYCVKDYEYENIMYGESINNIWPLMRL